MKKLLIALMGLLILSTSPTFARGGYGGHCYGGRGFGGYHGGFGGYRGFNGYRNFGYRGYGYRGGYGAVVGSGLVGAGIGLGLGCLLSNRYNNYYGNGSSYPSSYTPYGNPGYIANEAPPPFITAVVTDYDYNGYPYQHSVTANWDNARGGYWYVNSAGRYSRAQ